MALPRFSTTPLFSIMDMETGVDVGEGVGVGIGARAWVDVDIGVDQPPKSMNGNVYYGWNKRISVIITRLLILCYMKMLRPVAVLLLKVREG